MYLVGGYSSLTLDRVLKLYQYGPQLSLQGVNLLSSYHNIIQKNL